MSKHQQEMILWIDSSRGQYIPQAFALSFANRAKNVTGVDEDTWAILEAGPEHEEYWDAWSSIDNAFIIADNGLRYHVLHDEDVWLVPVGMEWNDKKGSFVWPWRKK
jgi:hypothetical protein